MTTVLYLDGLEGSAHCTRRHAWPDEVQPGSLAV